MFSLGIPALGAMLAYEEYNGDCYKFHGANANDPRTTHSAAKDICTTEGANFPVINTYERFKAIEYMMTTCEYNCV